jgi:transcriptional regulator with XRE-family HTH domain
MTFGPRMRQRRLQIGLSQGELSRRTGIPTTRLSEFENGARTEMTLSTALKLARALGMSLDALAGTWQEEAPPTLAAEGLAPEPRRRRGRPRKAAPVPAGARG